MPFSTEQVEQLLHPINPTRVLRDGKGHAHVSQQDVLAHLIRVFGFGAFDTEVLQTECVFEAERTGNAGRYDVCYRALVRLTVRDPQGVELCHYENGSTATAQNQTRGDAHDLAYKSAISLSVKRAAIALGDQFGLSLYNKGQMGALVMGTLVGRDKPQGKRDMQEGVPQQVSLGNDEIDSEPDPPPAEPPPPPVTRTMSRKPKDEPEPITKAQSAALHASFNGAGVTERTARLAYCRNLIGRDITSSSELTRDEASRCIDALHQDAQDTEPGEAS